MRISDWSSDGCSSDLHVFESAAGLAHGRENIVAGAVEDTVNTRDTVAGQTFAQRLYDRDAPADSRLVGEDDSGRFGGIGKLGSVQGKQSLVCRHDMAPGGDRHVQYVTGDAAAAADTLDDHIGNRTPGHFTPVVAPAIHVTNHDTTAPRTAH